MWRYCRASEEGIREANNQFLIKSWTQDYLASAVGCHPSTVIKFFARQFIDKSLFHKICSQLDLESEKILERELEKSTTNLNFNMELEDTCDNNSESIINTQVLAVQEAENAGNDSSNLYEAILIFNPKLMINIEAEVEDEKEIVKAVSENLQELTEDVNLIVKKIGINDGRIIIYGSSESLKKLHELFELGDLVEVLGIPLEDIELFTTENIEKENYRLQLIKRINAGENLGNDLVGADLSGMSLSGANLENFNLREANLENAKLVKTNLVNAYLEHANLINANLREANLVNAYLEKANLVNANLREANLVNANLREANLTNAHLENSYLVNAYLENANIREANLVNAYLREANLWCANLENAKLWYAYLESANLENAYLENANLREANLWYANLQSANLENTYLENANLREANLVNANLWNANLEKANLENANLENVNLREAHLKNANLWNANLENAYLENADLENVRLENANLWNANLENANLANANLANADLENANLENTIVTNALFNQNSRGITEEMKCKLESRGAIFEDRPPVSVKF